MAKKPLYPHVPKRKEPLFPHGPPRREKLYQRGPDGYPVGSDRIMREGYGPIPDPDQPFLGKRGWERPAEVYGWQWSDDYHQWRASVRFPDGTETWTSPQHRAKGSLKDFMAQNTLELSQEPGPLPGRDAVRIGYWQERDRLGIWIIDKRTDRTIAEWWDEDAREMFEQGWFKPGVPQRDIDKPSRAFLESVLDYAEGVGLIAGRDEYVAQTVKPEHRRLLDLVDEPLPPDAY